VTALAEVIEACEPTVAAHGIADPGTGRFDPAEHGEVRAFVLEVVYEGYLLHYETPRAFEGLDDDLRLLAGDALYALGLERLAEDGDLEAVRELSDLISLSAWAHAEGHPERAKELWAASAEALTPGGGRGAAASVAGDLAPQR